MGKKKRGKTIVVITIVAVLALITLLVFINNFNKDINLSPSQPTQVRVQVKNSPPTITSIQSIPNVNLNPSPSTTNVVFTFIARDSNGANELVDSSAFAQFTNTGEPTRSGTCSFQSTAQKEKAYQCTIPMNYYDKSGIWTVTVGIQDAQAASVQGSSTFTVNLLRDISITPTTINFPAAAPGDLNVRSADNTTITNNGNFQAPPGTISATAFDLTGETNSTEKIPAANFKIAGSSQSNVCGSGNSLTHASSITVTTSNLSRGATGNTEKLSYCLTTVPEISSQYYSATGGNSWVININ